MLKVITLALGLCCAVAITAQAADGEKKAEGKRPAQTEEQKTLRKDMTKKYDADKNGRLSAEERKAMSTEEKEKWDKAFPKKKKEESK